MIKAVLFDYGLVLSGPADPRAWSLMKTITATDEETFNRAYWAPRHDYDRGTFTAHQYWRQAAHHAAITLSDDQVEALIEADTDLWTQSNQPMIDWAQRLQAAGTRTGILSNLGDQMTLGVLRRMPWLADFDARIFSHTLKLAKPEPAIYQHAIAALATPAHQILFLDDRPINCEAAREAGMQTIEYTHYPTFLAELESRHLTPLWQTGKLT